MKKQRDPILLVLVLVCLGLLLTLIFSNEWTFSRLKDIETELEALSKKLDEVEARGVTSTERSLQEDPVERVKKDLDFTQTPATKGGVLRLAMMSDPSSLNPIVSNDASASTVKSFCLNSLLTLDPDRLVLVPELAVEWELSEDKKSVTFRLRQGVSWSDGVPLKAEDVKFTFSLMMNKRVNAPPIQSYFKDFDGIEVLGEDRVKVSWKEPYFKMVEMVSSVSILPSHEYRKKYGLEDESSEAFADAFNQDNLLPRVVTGNYRLMNWETGREIRLERNLSSWEKGLGNYDTVLYRIIKDRTAMRQRLKNRELDSMSFMVQEYMEDKDSPLVKEHFNIHDYYATSYSYIGYNQRQSKFKDPKVRQAMTHLVDREGIVNEIVHGHGKVVTGPFFFETDFVDPSLEPHAHDPQKALTLLKEAGWMDRKGDGLLRNDKGEVLRFNVVTNSQNIEREQIARLFVESCKRVGIDASYQYLEWSVLLDKIDNHNFDAVILGWSMGVLDPDPYQLWHSSQTKKSGSNFTGYENEEVDALIVENRTCFDRDRRIEICRRIHQILHRDQPYTFVYSRKSFVPVSKKVQRQLVHPTGMNSLEWHP